MSDQDRRVFMYRGKEAKLFNSPEDVPDGEGWKDAPYDLEEQPVAEAPVKRKKKAEAEPVETDGDSN